MSILCEKANRCMAEVKRERDGTVIQGAAGTTAEATHAAAVELRSFKTEPMDRP